MQRLHTTDGTPLVGPSLLGIHGSVRLLEDGTPVLADDDCLRESIQTPEAKLVHGYSPSMPAYDRLTEHELDALIDHIKTFESSP